MAALVGAGAIVAYAGTALAADLPTAQPAYSAPATLAERAMNWSGFYAGVNGGYAQARIATVANTVVGDNMTGEFVGGQIGWQFQDGVFVWGVEGDGQASWQKNRVTAAGLSGDEKIPWFATARARAGFTFDQNRAMLFVTGGGAYVNLKVTATSGGASLSSDVSRAGWTVGGGFEYMFANHWSAKVEYLYIDIGSTNVTLFGTNLAGSLKDNLARAGVNYHF